MAKQVLMSERPAYANSNIGNFKGVMLCNRPNDPPFKAQKDGPTPFISRVNPQAQLGLNPTFKLQPKKKAKGSNLEILKRHKQWLQQLQKQKEEQAKQASTQEIDELEKRKRFADKAAKRRTQIKESDVQEVNTYNLKSASESPEDPSKEKVKILKPTERNLATHEKKSRDQKKPKWAMTNEQAEAEEEKEVDDLLNFVSDLDYEAYISDLEVRQALEIVKERIHEIKQDQEWKQNIAAKYNQEISDDEEEAQDRVTDLAKPKSVASDAQSLQSFVSKARSKLAESKRNPDNIHHPDWDTNVTSIQTRADGISISAEEKVAKRVADQVLQSRPVILNSEPSYCSF